MRHFFRGIHNFFFFQPSWSKISGKTFISAELREKRQYQYILRTPAQITWALCQKLKSRIIARTWIVLGSNSLFRLHVANVIKTNLIWSTLCFWISCCSCKLWKLCPNLSPQQTHNITCHFSKLTIDQLAVYYITRATRALPSALKLFFKTHLHFLPYYQMAKIVCVAEPIFYFSSSGPY